MLPDLRLLIPATVATFFLAAVAGLFASVRMQESLSVDNRAAAEESPITRISSSWPMPDANRAVAMRQLSAMVKDTALAPAPLKAPPEPAFTAPVAAPALPETVSIAPAATPAPAPNGPVEAPAPVASLPAPADDSDGRPDLPPLAQEPEQEPKHEPAKEDVVKAYTPEDIPNDKQPDEPASTGAVSRNEPEAPSVVASRSPADDAVAPAPTPRPVPEVVVRRKPASVRASRAKRRVYYSAQPQAQAQSQSRPPIQPAPDLKEIEPYERYSRSPANIYFTAVY